MSLNSGTLSERNSGFLCLKLVKRENTHTHRERAQSGATNSALPLLLQTGKKPSKAKLRLSGKKVYHLFTSSEFHLNQVVHQFHCTANALPRLCHFPAAFSLTTRDDATATTTTPILRAKSNPICLPPFRFTTFFRSPNSSMLSLSSPFLRLHCGHQTQIDHPRLWPSNKRKKGDLVRYLCSSSLACSLPATLARSAMSKISAKKQSPKECQTIRSRRAPLEKLSLGRDCGSGEKQKRKKG